MLTRAKKREALMRLMRSVASTEDMPELLGVSPKSEFARDRSVALLVVASLERSITPALKTHFKENPSDPEYNKIFESEGAPLRADPRRMDSR